MELEKARQLYAVISSSKHQVLVKSLVKTAIRYARIRVDWYLLDLEGKKEMDDERSRAHTAFIDTCDILSRNMMLAGEDNHWRKEIGSDRKTVGDFACMLHAVIGIKAR